MKKILFYLTLIIVILSGCNKVDNDPNEPIIHYRNQTNRPTYKDNEANKTLYCNIYALSDTSSGVKVGELNVHNDKDSLYVTYIVQDSLTYQWQPSQFRSYKITLTETSLWVGTSEQLLNIPLVGDKWSEPDYSLFRNKPMNDTTTKTVKYSIPLSQLDYSDTTITYVYKMDSVKTDSITTYIPTDVVDSIIYNISYKPLYIISHGKISGCDQRYFDSFNGFIPRTVEEINYFVFDFPEIDPIYRNMMYNRNGCLYTIYYMK